MRTARLLAQQGELAEWLRRDAPPAASPPPPAAASVPPHGRELSRPRVQNVLLGLGALLVAAAGVIFVVLTWQHGGVIGRAVTLAVASLLAVVGCVVAVRRGMPATGEALGAVAVVLAVLDGYALRHANLGGLAGGSPATYWSVAFAMIAGLMVAGAMVVPLRAWRLAAAVVGQLPLLIVAVRLGAVSRWPAFGFGLTLEVQAAGLVVLAAALHRRPTVRDAWYVLAWSVPVTWSVAFTTALIAAYADSYPPVTGAGNPPVTGVALLLGLGLVGVLAAWLGRGMPHVRHGASAAATMAVLLAAWTPAQLGLETRWRPPALAGLGLAGMLLAFVLHRRWRPGPVAVSAAATLLAGRAALEPVTLAVAGAVGWLVRPWTSPGTGTAGDALAGGLQWESGVELPVLLAALAASAAVAGRVAGRTATHRRAGDAAAVAVLAAGLATAPLVAGFPYRVAVGWDLAVAAAGLVVGLGPAATRRVEVHRTAAGAPVRPTGAASGVRGMAADAVVGRTAAGAGAVLAALGLCWSLATPAVTTGAFGAALVGLLALLRFRPLLRGPAATTVAVALAAVETAAIARTARADAGLGGMAVACLGAVVVAGAGLLRTGGRSSAAPAPAARQELAAETAGAVVYLVGAGVCVAGGAVAGTGRPWTATVVVAAGAVVAAIAACLSRTLLRVAWAGAAAALCCLLAVVVGWWIGLGSAGTTLAVAVTAAALGPAGTWLAGRLIPRSEPVEVVAVAGYVLAVVGLAADPRRLWLALLAGAAGYGLAAVHPGRRPAGWVAGLLAAGSSWVRLALAQVNAPDAYTAPLGAALVVVGYLRRRADRDLPSWPAYGLGLSLILVPSLLLAATDTGLARPLILGAAALAVLLAGAARRLQAPLILGGATLAADALIQLSPYLATTYSALPRWLTIGAAGLLLLGIGATYERRLGQLRRLRTTIGRLT